MKIILANKFYYPRGGDCIYTIETERLLKSNGHDTAIFSQKYDENLSNEFSVYWPSKVEYSTKNIKNLSEALLRPIYSKEVKKKFKKLVDDFKPDIVHLNNVHSQLSPIIAQFAYEYNIPVVWTLHDYKLLCPSYSCLRDGKVCELCYEHKINVIKHRCVKNFIGSTIAYIESKKWSRERLQQYTSRFIAPSEFMKKKMVQGGFDGNKITVLNNFIDGGKLVSSRVKKGDYYLYFGRFSNEKGVETLLKAATRLPYKLKLAGTGPLLLEFKKKYKSDNIEFLGFLNWDKLKEVIMKAQFIVIPSEWYENNPLTIIESFALGTPVIGANIGGIPELIDENKTGLLFEYGNQCDLINSINKFYSNLDSNEMGKKAIQYVRENFLSSNYYARLIKIYESIKR